MHGDDPFAALRHELVERQLRGRGIHDEGVLRAMDLVPRERFVPATMVASAYDDCPLPIGQGQTISQPYTVAFMAQEARLRPSDRVLEIGTGSGYGAAVLGQLAADVFTVERIESLADEARQRLAALGYVNVHVRISDGTVGLAEEGPYDAIVVTAGAESLPEAYLEQLAGGGRIVIPVGRVPYQQSLYRFTRTDGQLRVENLGGFAFVPLIGEFGWSEGEARQRP